VRRIRAHCRRHRAVGVGTAPPRTHHQHVHHCLGTRVGPRRGLAHRRRCYSLSTSRPVRAPAPSPPSPPTSTTGRRRLRRRHGGLDGRRLGEARDGVREQHVALHGHVPPCGPTRGRCHPSPSRARARRSAPSSMSRARSRCGGGAGAASQCTRRACQVDGGREQQSASGVFAKLTAFVSKIPSAVDSPPLSTALSVESSSKPHGTDP